INHFVFKILSYGRGEGEGATASISGNSQIKCPKMPSGNRILVFLVVVCAVSVFTAFTQSPTAQPPVADFQDLAEKAGLRFEIVSGDKNTKKYIIETTGSGVAIFDYDNDGWPDIFIVNGTTLDAQPGTAA